MMSKKEKLKENMKGERLFQKTDIKINPKAEIRIKSFFKNPQNFFKFVEEAKFDILKIEIGSESNELTLVLSDLRIIKCSIMTNTQNGEVFKIKCLERKGENFGDFEFGINEKENQITFLVGEFCIGDYYIKYSEKGKNIRLKREEYELNVSGEGSLHTKTELKLLYFMNLKELNPFNARGLLEDAFTSIDQIEWKIENQPISWKVEFSKNKLVKYYNYSENEGFHIYLDESGEIEEYAYLNSAIDIRLKNSNITIYSKNHKTIIEEYSKIQERVKEIAELMYKN